MDSALLLSALAMGVAASPHCAAMCGAPCAALSGGGRRSAIGFQFGRLLSYMAGGALAAASVGLLAEWSRALPVLRPLWLLLHMALLALGLWWLASGRQPDWMKRDRAVPVQIVRHQEPNARATRATLAGLAWVAWPCGVSQSALLLAALASTPQGGALTMAAFATGSMPALLAGPWVWSRWQARHGGAVAGVSLATLGFRVAGVALVLSSGWALTHGMWSSIAAWCGL
jgi:sulfite exporter TauE/SafE